MKHPSFNETYFAKLQEPAVLSIVYRNKQIMETFSDFVDAASENVSELVRNRFDSFSQKVNDEIKDQIKDSFVSLIEYEDQAEGSVF